MRYIIQFSCKFPNSSITKSPRIYLDMRDRQNIIQSTYSFTNDNKLGNCQKWRNIQFTKTDYHNYTFIYGCENSRDRNSHYDGLWIFVNQRYPPSSETQATISQIIDTQFADIKHSITFVNSSKGRNNCSCKSIYNEDSCADDSYGIWNSLLLFLIPVQLAIVIVIIYKCACNSTKRCVLCYWRSELSVVCVATSEIS